MTDCHFCHGERPAADHRVADLGITVASLHDDQYFYEPLGNQTPHIHWHVIPRLVDDPAPLEAVWAVPPVPCRLDATTLVERRATLRVRLGA